MSRHLLYCWELGQGYGHILNFRHLALHLLQLGWQLSCVVKNPDISKKLLPEVERIQAIPPLVRQIQYNPTRNLAEILVNNGFHTHQQTLHRCQTWLGILADLQPDIVLVDHAPMALLSCRAAGIPCVITGTGFFIPPNTHPLPSLLGHWLGDAQSDAELQVLFQCNTFLQSAGKPPLEYVSQLFHQTDARFLCTLPEFDHYQQRRNGEYWGPCFDFSQGTVPQWPRDRQPRIFVYLHRDFSAIHTVLEQLHELDAGVLLHIAGLEPGIKARYPRFIWSEEAVNLSMVAEQSDLVICHAGHGTISGMLLKSVPLLLLPKQLEQWILAELLCYRHLAYFIPPEGDYHNLSDKIARVLGDKKLCQSLAAFARTYAGFSPEEQKQGMLEALQAILAQKNPT